MLGAAISARASVAREMLAPALLLAVWTIAVGGGYLGGLPVPKRALPYLLLAVPAALAFAVFVRVGPERPLRLLAGGTCLVSAALLFAAASAPLAAGPIVAGVPYGLIALALIARRWPATTIITAFTLDSAYGSIKAFLGLPANGVATALIGGMLVACIAGAVLGRRESAIVVWPAAVVAGVYLLLTVVMFAFSPALDPAFKVLRTTGLYMVAFLVIAYGPWRPITHERIKQAVVLVALLVGAYATLRWAIGAAPKEKALVTSTTFNQVTVGTDKVQGSFPSGVELGVWTTIVIPFLLATLLTARGWIRLVALGALPVCLIGLLGSGLRAGVPAALAGAAIVLVTYGLARGMGPARVAAVVAAILALVAGGVALFPTVIGHDPASVQRYQNLLSPSNDPSVQGRLDKWRQALIDIRGHPFGHGLGTIGPEGLGQRFQTNTNQFIDNSYLRVAYEQGFAGMALFAGALLLLLAGLLRRGIWIRDRARAGPAIAAAGTLVAFMLIMVADVITTAPVSLSAWVIVGLGVAPFARLPAPPAASAPGGSPAPADPRPQIPSAQAYARSIPASIAASENAVA
jgi:hypothetical protein